MASCKTRVIVDNQIEITPASTPTIQITAHAPVIIEDGDWDLPTGARSVTILVLAASAGNAVTITDDDGSVDLEDSGISLSYSGGSDGSTIDGGAFNVAATGTGKALVTWTS